MQKRDVMVEVHELEKQTDKAIQVSIDHELFWLPKKHTRLQNLKDKTTGEIKGRRVIIPYWLAEEKGFLVKSHGGHSVYNYFLVDPE